ncbi:HTH_Tnp_Tc3_2 domain-containing protein [Trichonephila clavipes]|nr:HTH_Tnp_Tc3_2 domain-containing protein [Trichonephila clavipes]
MKEGCWANRRIARHMVRSDAAIRRCWQEWVDKGIFQLQDGSGRSRATADRQDRLIFRLAVTELDASLLTVRRTTRTRLSIMTIHRRLDRAKFTLVPTATPPATNACKLSRQITVVLCSIRLESC